VVYICVGELVVIFDPDVDGISAKCIDELVDEVEGDEEGDIKVTPFFGTITIE